MKLIYQVYLTHRWKFSRSNQTPRPKDGESLLIGKPNPVHIRNMGPTHFCIYEAFVEIKLRKSCQIQSELTQILYQQQPSVS